MEFFSVMLNKRQVDSLQGVDKRHSRAHDSDGPLVWNAAPGARTRSGMGEIAYAAKPQGSECWSYFRHIE